MKTYIEIKYIDNCTTLKFDDKEAAVAQMENMIAARNAGQDGVVVRTAGKNPIAIIIFARVDSITLLGDVE